MDAPIEYPTLTLEGKQYELKFDNRTLYNLGKQGIDLRALGERLKGGNLDYAMLVDLAAAALQRKPRFSADDLTEHLSPYDSEHIAGREGIPLDKWAPLIFEAMGKAQRGDVKLKEPGTVASANPVQ